MRTVTVMRVRCSVFVALLLFAAACDRFSRPTLSAIQQDVIEAVIADNDNSAPAVKRGLFQRSSIRSAFVGDMTYPTLIKELHKNAEYRDQAFHDALEDFLRVNAPEETKLIFPTKLPNTIVLVPDEEIRKIYDHIHTLQEADAAIRARFHGIDGIYQVSKPGIDAHRSLALICLSYSSAPGTVIGRFYILKFEGGKWVVQKDDFFGPSWMS